MALTPIDFFNGSLSVVFVVISLLVGARLILKYFQTKEKIFLLVGFSWVFFCELWWSASISFLVALVNGVGLSPEIYFFLGNFIISLGILIWLAAFTELLYKDKQKIILIIFGIIGAVYEVLIYIIIFTDVSIIGEMRGPVDGNYYSFALFFLLTGLILFVITGIILARNISKSEKPEDKLRAKFMILAAISFLIGAGLDGLKPFLFPNFMDVIYIIDRFVLISSAVEFYLSFNLPNWLKRRFNE